MDPIVTIVDIGGAVRPIGSYGVMQALAVCLGLAMAVRAAARAGIEPGAAVAVLGVGVGGAFLGAGALFALVQWVRTGAPGAGLTPPGLVFFGAPFGGLPALWGACRYVEVPFGRLVDAATPAVPTAHALGRLGCFLGGCCYGAPWDGPWAVRYTHVLAPGAHPSVWRHPTPLYEASALALIALVFVLTPPRRVGNGRRLLAYGGIYAVLRLGLETLRGDAVRGVWLDGGLSTSQLIALGILLGVLAVGGKSVWPWLARIRSRALSGEVRAR